MGLRGRRSLKLLCAGSRASQFPRSCGSVPQLPRPWLRACSSRSLSGLIGPIACPPLSALTLFISQQRTADFVSATTSYFRNSQKRPVATATVYTDWQRRCRYSVAANAAVRLGEGSCLPSGEQGSRALGMGRREAGKGGLRPVTGSCWNLNTAPRGSSPTWLAGLLHRAEEGAVSRGFFQPFCRLGPSDLIFPGFTKVLRRA